MLLSYPNRPRLFILAAITCLFTGYILLCYPGGSDTLARPNIWPVSSLSSSFSSLGAAEKEGPQRPLAQLPQDNHPISRLIRDAHNTYMDLVQNRSHTVEEAAARYRLRRGRHPPPGFDVWFQATKQHDAVVVEEFFDRIYRDIGPFWALNPVELRRMAHATPQVIRVRGGNATFETDDPHRPPFIQLWTDLVREMAHALPDLDMPVNVMDESRVLVPWEKMAGYVGREVRSREVFPAEQAINAYTSHSALDSGSVRFQPQWVTDDAHRYWDHMRAACPPHSPARAVGALPSSARPIDELYPIGPLPYTREGFVANFSASMDACWQPHMRGMHGTFVESVSMSTVHELVPMFGGCKLPQNNEILLPGAMYLTDDPFYAGGRDKNLAWADKKDGAVWRGVASGGRNRPDNWWHLHRHRWLQVMNGSTVRRVQAGEEAAGPTFRLPPQGSVYREVTAAKEVKGGRGGKKEGGKDTKTTERAIGDWLEGVADVGFNNLECYPITRDEEGRQEDLGCEHTGSYFAVSAMVPMTEQYSYKYLPDVDGHSYSARWRGILRSSSCPLKATLYAEWHDDRLVPWVHFAPFDSSYQDIWAVLSYFLDGHDAEGERIARASKEWAAKVLRREDMMLYVWRLLLEYARVMDPKRDRLGFVNDLEVATKKNGKNKMKKPSWKIDW